MAGETTISRCRQCKEWITNKTIHLLKADGNCSNCFISNLIREQYKKEQRQKKYDNDN